MSDLKEERAIISTFFALGTRDRAIGLLSNPDWRADFIKELAGSLELEERYVQKIPAATELPAKIHQFLSALGAPPTCYLISSNTEIDGKTLPLLEALNTIVESGDETFLSCIPGKLAYYETADKKSRYLLNKRSN